MRRNLAPAVAYLLMALAIGAGMLSAFGPLTLPDPDLHVPATLAASGVETRTRTAADGAGNTVRIMDVALSRALMAGYDNRTVTDILASGPVAIEADGPDAGAMLVPTRTNQYPPLAYLPAGLAARIMRLAGRGWHAQLQAGRVMNLACTLLSGLLAIRLAGGRSWAMMLILTDPIRLFLAASLNADWMIGALAALMAALALRPESKACRIGFIACCLPLAALKLAYLPFALLPRAAGGRSRRRRLAPSPRPGLA